MYGKFSFMKCYQEYKGNAKHQIKYPAITRKKNNNNNV